MIQKLLLLALAGAVGTLTRYGIAGLVQRIAGASFPWGTMTVNICGCFLAGLLWALFENRWPVSGDIRAMLLIGFMGAFTTFSAFILETGQLARSAEWMSAILNLFAQIGFGLIALTVGAALGRTI
ncbi:MAG TPA: CrcB family protein [candidate division Zixibacteria bacterium]|nr:CrcB family protein [candidate division Zixibacteria bacterium]